MREHAIVILLTNATVPGALSTQTGTALPQLFCRVMVCASATKEAAEATATTKRDVNMLTESLEFE